MMHDMIPLKYQNKGETMSIIKSTGVVDTAMSGVTAPTLDIPLLNFNADFRVKTESTKETILVNTSSPLDQLETVRFGYSEIANIYSKSGLNSDQISGTVKGLNVLAQVNNVLKVTDSANAAFSQYLPISAHLVLKVPQSGYITPDVVQALIARLVATLYENGVSNLSALTKGVLTPKSL